MLGIKDIHSGHYEDAFINIRGIFLVKNSWEGLERKCFKRCIMIFTKPDIKIITKINKRIDRIMKPYKKFSIYVYIVSQNMIKKVISYQ